MAEFATYRMVLDTEKVRNYLLEVMEAAPHEIAMAAAEMENRMNAGEFYPDTGTQTRFDCRKEDRES
jgi:hypothetical protein